MGIEFSCASGNCEFLARSDDEDELYDVARRHVADHHGDEGYDIEEDIRRT